jgi:predicted nucleotidyltransferase component of viral defense system
MLFYETVDIKLLELLKKLQRKGVFSDLRLVGGTSLALQLGHRKSVDIDLFGVIHDDFLAISKALDELGTVIHLNKSDNINIYLINGIKVDLVNYHYKWLEEPIISDDLLLADSMDIAAMKLSAITNRGTKKDFIDLYFLLQKFKLDELLGFYSNKYHDGSIFFVLKSLTYFEDADQHEMPVMLKPLNWEDVKSYIQETTKNYLK